MYNPGDICPYLNTNKIYGNILEESKDIFFYSNCKQSLQPEVIQKNMFDNIKVSVEKMFYNQQKKRNGAGVKIHKIIDDSEPVLN